MDGLNLTARQGELLSLLGVNGAGKTTTIKMLTGLTRPTSGDAFLNVKSILTESAAIKAMIAVSPQETAVAPNLTVRENLELMAGIHGFLIVLLLLLTVIQRNIPVALFEIEHLAPGIVVFGLSFMTLFSATLIAKDRGSSFLQRLYTTPLTAWLSGIWFDLRLVGGAFQKIANLLPFVHAVEMGRAVLQGDYAGVFPHIWWVTGYAAAVTAIAVFAFLRQMKKQ